MFAAQDSIQRQIYVTSKHRAAFVPELSKQTSRDTAPFFVQNPTPNSGATIQGFPEKQRRHMQSPLPLDKSVGRNDPNAQPKPDRRDYNPRTYTELHPKSSVSIGRAPERTTNLGLGEAGQLTKDIDTSIDPFKVPSWGATKESTSKKGTMSQCSRDKGGAFTPPRSHSAMDSTRMNGTVGSAGSPTAGSASGRRSKNMSFYGRGVEKTLISHHEEVSAQEKAAQQRQQSMNLVGSDSLIGETFDGRRARDGSAERSRRSRSAMLALPPDPTALESKYATPKGGTIPKSDERAMPPAPDRPELKVNMDSVSRKVPGSVSLGKGPGRKEPSRNKQAATYLPMFRLPPPRPLERPEKRRTFGGYALQRYNARGTDVAGLLRAAESDVKRSRSCMDQNFKVERSDLRTNLLYTPSPANQHTSQQPQSPNSTMNGTADNTTSSAAPASRYTGHGL